MRGEASDRDDGQEFLLLGVDEPDETIRTRARVHDCFDLEAVRFEVPRVAVGHPQLTLLVDDAVDVGVRGMFGLPPPPLLEAAGAVAVDQVDGTEELDSKPLHGTSLLLQTVTHLFPEGKEKSAAVPNSQLFEGLVQLAIVWCSTVMALYNNCKV